MQPTRSKVPPWVESVLHPTDFSPASERAFAHALAVSLLRRAPLTILHVEKTHEPDWTAFPAVRGALERWGLLPPGSDRRAVLAELGVSVEKVVLPSRFPVFAIHDYLASHPSDLLVLATEGRDGAARWLHRSVAEAMAGSSRTMTLFVPARAERNLVSVADGELRLDSVLVPVDHRPNPWDAVEFARRTAEAIGDHVVPITLLHVGDDDGPATQLADGDTWSFVRARRSGDPVTRILEVADEVTADLIVMPTAGHDGVLDALRGSTTERVLRHARCPLLAVPARNES